MGKEQSLILEMLSSGKITPEQAIKLLNAIGDEPEAPPEPRMKPQVQIDIDVDREEIEAERGEIEEELEEVEVERGEYDEESAAARAQWEAAQRKLEETLGDIEAGLGRKGITLPTPP